MFATPHRFCVRPCLVNFGNFLSLARAAVPHVDRPPRAGLLVGMDYTQLFRKFREEKGLTLEQLADLAGVHRNTVVNIEAGRPVKFKTIAALMDQLGYSAGSAELKSMALLWLESVSGIPFSRAEPQATAKKLISSYRSSAKQAARQLEQAVLDANLDAEQIGLLIYAARHGELISILQSVRDLTTSLASTSRDAGLKAAEDAGDYSEE